MEGAVKGKPDITALVIDAGARGADMHVCGPEGFQVQIQKCAIQARVLDRLHMDSFATPDRPVEMRGIPESGSFNVTFAQSGVTAAWHPADGALLNFAEAKRLVLPAYCRAGLCQTCECAVLEESIFALTASLTAKLGYALICAAVPGSDIKIDC
ncbi:2Fe-2S iron-sulfur cluster-binding protein [Pseudomonas putida]|uniref:2Fe-2S iron-sulfur cluster-binding protein n=1 Tax=Pseudomonas putida TaxID=303 RepID=UPI003570F0E4